MITVKGIIIFGILMAALIAVSIKLESYVLNIFDEVEDENN